MIQFRGVVNQVEVVRAEVSRIVGLGVGVRTCPNRELFKIRDLDKWTTIE